MAERELWELSNEESFSKGQPAGLGPPLLYDPRLLYVRAVWI
jgi:hypothetical protein